MGPQASFIEFHAEYFDCIIILQLLITHFWILIAFTYKNYALRFFRGKRETRCLGPFKEVVDGKL